MTPDTAILTTLLNTFVTAITGGYARIAGDALTLLQLLALLEVALAALWWMLTDDDALVGLIKRVLGIGLFVFFVTTYPALLSSVLEGFVQTGLKAGGAPLTTLTDPSAIVTLGIQVSQPIIDHVAAYSVGSALANILDVVMSLTAALLILLAYFVMAIQVFVTYLEFYLVAVLGLILLPFGVFRPTAFLAEKVFGAVISFGVKLMVLGFILGVTLPVVRTFRLPPDPTWQQALLLLLASAAVTFLAWHGPAVAASLLAGTPSLTAGLATGTAVAAAVGTRVLVQPMLAAGRGAVSLTTAAGRASLSTGSASPGPSSGAGSAALRPPAPPSRPPGPGGNAPPSGPGPGAGAPPSPSGPPGWAQRLLGRREGSGTPPTPP